jgi:hypothetical protein
MIPHDLEKAWLARAPRGPIFSAPTFVGDRLMLGAQTEIAVARKAGLADSTSARERDARMIALLSAAYGAPVSDSALAYLRRALEKRTEGDALLASTHLAMAGYWPLRNPLAAARRVFFSDGLMNRGATPAMILAALDLDPRRLDALERFDPSQPRVPAGNGVESGRWTRNGVATSSNEITVSDEAPSDEDSLFSRNLSRAAANALLRLAARFGAPTILFGALFVPSDNRTHVHEGLAPGRNDLSFSWDALEGTVRYHAFIDGHWVTLSQARNYGGPLYLDAHGNVLARAVGDSLVVDVDALDRARERLADNSGGQPPREASSDERGGPKLCPEPSRESNEGWSANSIAYQQYVSGLEPEFAIWLNGVSFDGCDPATGDMLEAKANYEHFLDPDGAWNEVWGNAEFDRLLSQMTRQADAAVDGRQVVWHVQQQSVTVAMQAMANLVKKPNLTVLFDPGPRQ